MSAARRRRRLPLEVMAERALTTRPTISRMEKGDPSVSMGVWASALFVLGLADRLGDLVSPANDELGLILNEERLPLRARPARSRSLPETRGGGTNDANRDTSVLKRSKRQSRAKAPPSAGATDDATVNEQRGGRAEHEL
jgi:hypothetical protein